MLDEYIQIGRISEWKAQKTFNSKRGKFSSYLYKIIQRDIFSHIRKSNKYIPTFEIHPNVEQNESECIWEYTEKLSGLEKNILQMFLNGCSYKEIENNYGYKRGWAYRKMKCIKEKIKGA